MAYRHDGKRGLLGTKKAGFSWPATAPAFEPKHLTAAPTSAWLTNGGSTYNQRYSPLDEIDTENVDEPQGRVDDRPRGLGDRGEVLGRGAADRLRRRHLRPHRRGRRLRGERGHRQDPLAVRRQAQPEDQHRLLRLAEPRRRARRRQGLPRPARRLAGRARPEDGEAGLVDRGRLVAEGLHDHGGAPLLRRARDHRSLRRRVLDPRARPGLRREDGQASSGASTRFPARARSATTPGRRQRRVASTAAHRCGRRRPSTRSSGSCTSRRATRHPTWTAAGARATTCSPPRSSPSTSRPAKYRWHYQQVHHDIWDYDAPSPVVLFDVDVDGERRKALARGEQDRLGLPPRPQDR